MMYERTIAQKGDELISRVDDALERARADAMASLDRTNEQFFAQLELGTYVIAGALVVGFIAAAVILRTSGS